jgi:NADPH:quinone reductase-like Zn-dependent oxidoreductase
MARGNRAHEAEAGNVSVFQFIRNGQRAPRKDLRSATRRLPEDVKLDTKMKAYHIDQFGSLDGIVLHDDPVPKPSLREVLVRVHARSLNYRDILILRKQYPLPAAQGVVPISDGAGEVVAVGEGVSRVAIGDRVAGTYFPRWEDGRLEPEMGMEQFGCTRGGMLAEFVAMDEQSLVKIPPGLSYQEASTLPCAGVTAWSALTGPRRILPGEIVLTIGSGGVALFALQFAKLFGARTIAITSSSHKVEILEKLGADEVVDYKRNADWDRLVRTLTGGRGVDYVVETGTVETLAKSLSICAWNGEVALVLASPTGGSIDIAAFRGLVTARRVFVGSRASFEAMNRAITTHNLRPVIDRVFPFGEARAAYKHFEARQQVGKVVIADS